MKTILALVMVFAASQTWAASYHINVAPFPWDSVIAPRELVSWERQPVSNSFDMGTFTYISHVKGDGREALLLIQVPHDRLVGYAYYQGGELFVYNVSILRERYIRIPISKAVRKLVNRILGGGDM